MRAAEPKPSRSVRYRGRTQLEDPLESPTAAAAIARLSIPAEPPKELRFRREINLLTALRDVWRSREMVRALVEREIRSRYKQAVLSWGWAMVTPLALMLVFSVFVKRVAAIDTGDIPYPLFSYLGLIPWSFFSSSVTFASGTMLSNKALLKKIYCPREMFSIAAVATAGVDALIASIGLVALFAIFTVMPEPTALVVPLLVLLQVLFNVGVALVISVTTVHLRDVRHALPLIMQFGLLATPIAYGIDEIPGKFHAIYSFANPLAPIIDGYRRTFLYNQLPQWDLLAIASLNVVLLLTAGYWLFKRLEATIADVA